MYSVLGYNYKDATYSVVDWDDFRVDRLTAKELYKCMKQLHFDVRGMDTVSSAYDSSFTHRELLDNLVLIEKHFSYDSSNYKLQVLLYDKSTGQKKSLLVDLSYGIHEGAYRVERAYCNLLGSTQVCIQVVISKIKSTYRYLYVFDRDIKSTLFYDVFHGGVSIKLGTANKTILVDGNPVYSWR